MIVKQCPPIFKSQEYQDILASAKNFINPRFETSPLSPYNNLPSSRSSSYKFQQDGAPVHRSKATKKWILEKHIRQFNDGIWPPNSPNMNAIEHVWRMVGRQLIGKIFPSKDALWAALEEAFSRVTPAQIGALYDSMPRRLVPFQRPREATPGTEVSPN